VVVLVVIWGANIKDTSLGEARAAQAGEKKGNGNRWFHIFHKSALAFKNNAFTLYDT